MNGTLESLKERMRQLLTSLDEDAGRNVVPQAAQPAAAGRRGEDTFQPWMLQEWRRVSIPQWRHILQESVQQEDSKREEYARWMLREVLLDPEYQEPGG